DLRAVPRRARPEPGPAARHQGAGRRADPRAAAGHGEASGRAFLPRYLPLRQGRERLRGAAPVVSRHATPPEGGVGDARRRRALQDALRGAHHGVDHREGNRPVGRARPDRRRADQPPAHRHAAAGRPDHHLRPRRHLRRQPEAQPPRRRRPLQHLHARRPAADADRDAGPGLAALGAAPGKDRRDVLRVQERRLEPLLAHAGRAQPGGRQVPAAWREMKRGKFLTLEGVDGAGKSTHVQFIADFVASKGHHAVMTREPGGTELAERLREAILGQRMDPTVETLLIFAGRADHVARVIRPALEAGSWVICDRFSDATAAYQGAGNGVPAKTIESLGAIAHPGLAPDRTLIFDCPYEVASQRLSASGKKLDRFESEDRAFFERVRATYLARAKAEPARIRVIDATLPVAEIRKTLERSLGDL